MRKNSPHVFVGAMDSDSDARVVEPGNYTYASNIINSAANLPGAATNIKGTTLQTYNLPSGTNIVLGTVEDKVCGSLVYFIFNSSDNHRILRWFQQDGHIEEISGGPRLDFDRYARVQGHIIDGELLYWTDAKSDKNTISGKEPRKINMTKGSNYNKQFVYDIYAGFDGQGQFKENDEFFFEVIDILTDEVLESQTITIPDGSYENDVEAGLEYIYDEIKAGDLDDYMTLERCDCKLTVTMETAGQKLVLTPTVTTIAPIVVPINHYGPLIGSQQTFHYSLKKEPPSCAPTPTYVGIPEIGYNNVRDGCFQFRARYVYDDGEVSHCSAISDIPLNNAAFGDPQEALNAIKVDYTDDRLNDVDWLSIIKYVDIMFRNGNDDVFRLVRRIPVCEIGIGEQYIIFANDNLYSVVPSDDLSVAGGDVQVLTNYFRVPFLAGTLSPIADESGNTTMAWGAVQEGQTCPTCVVGSVEAEVYDNEDLVDIIGTVEIINDEDASDTSINFPFYSAEDGGLDGFVVYLAGTKHYAISNNPADGSGDGSFRIQNVPRGQYVLRVASYACRYGGSGVTDGSIGSQYDLLNGLEWQKTSSPLIDCAGSVAATTLTYERVLNLYANAFTGPEFDLDAEAGYGTIQVQNYHRCAKEGDPLLGVNLYEFHFLDAEGLYSSFEERSSGLTVENLNVVFYQGAILENLVGSVRTDCNGYAWILAKDTNNGLRLRAAAASWGDDNSNSAQGSHVFDPAGDGWKMITDSSLTPNDLNDGESGYFINSIELFISDPNPGMSKYFVLNSSSEWSTDNRAVINGECVDINGYPIGDVLIWMQTNGRYETTNALGFYSLIVYAYDGTTNRTAFQELHATYPSDLAGLYPPDPLLDSTVFDIPDDSPFTAPDFVFGFAGGIVFNDRFRKSGGNYKVGIVYEEPGGRSPCGVTPFQNIRIPFHTEDGQYVPRRLKWTIESRPPSWATRFRIVITKDSFYESYKHLPVKKVQYVNIAENATAVTNVTYASGQATHIMLGLRTQIATDPNITPTLLMFRDNIQKGYSSKYGDRCRYMLDETQAPAFTDKIAEVAVAGEYIDGVDYYVVIPYTEIGREVKEGWMFEFFTPKAFEEEIYYETGYCYDILTGPNRHSGDVEDQDLTLPTLSPAIGYIRGGDTYWWNQQFQLGTDGAGFQLVTENESRSKFVDGRCIDIGRPFAVDLGTDEQFFTNRIRFTGFYVPSSRINNLSAFGSLDYISINRTFGTIKWLGMVHTVLLAVCQNKMQPLYVGKGRVADVSGNTFVGRTSSLLNIADETMADAGTLNPESIAVNDGRAYGWDLQRAGCWTFGQDGLTWINKGKVKYFRERHDERIKLDRDKDIVVGGFDRRYNLYWLTFGLEYYLGPENEPQGVLRDTLAFDPMRFSERRMGWITHSDMHSEAFGSVNDVFLVTNNGALYVAFDSDTYNEFFTIQNQSIIEFAMNADPQATKDFLSLRLQANRKWFADEIVIPPTASIPNGMASKLPSNRMILREGTYWAEFLRDQTDPHATFAAIGDATTRAATALLRGRTLKGDMARIKMKTDDGSVENIIFRIDVEYSDSQNTK